MLISSPCAFFSPSAKRWFLVAAFSIWCGCGWNPLGSKEDYVRRGRQFVAQSKYAEAALQYRTALQKDTQYGDAYLAYGQLLVRQNRLADGFNHLSKAVELMPASIEAKEELGRVAIGMLLGDPQHPQKLYQSAETTATALLNQNPNSFEGLRIEGYLSMVDSKTPAAIEYFRKAHALNPVQPEIATMLVQNLLNGGQFSEAESLAQSALNSIKNYGPLYDILYGHYMASRQINRAEQLLKLKISNNPGEAFFVIQLAEHYWREKNYQDADSLVQSLAANPKRYPSGILDAGDFYRRVGGMEQAASLYLRGLESDTNRKTDYRQRLVGIRLEQGRVSEAAALLDAILKEHPDDPDTIVSRASLRMATGQSGEMHQGVADLDKLLQRLPNNNEVRYSLARADWQIGRAEEAKALLQELLRRDPTHPKALREMADMAIKNRQPDEALGYAERLLAVDPNNVEARLVRTSAWALSGRFSEVRSELRLLMADNPDLLEPRLQMATLNLEEKRYEQAEILYRGVYQSEKDGFRGLRGLVNLYLVQGQPKKALALLHAEKRDSHVEVRTLLAQAAAQAGQTDLARDTLEKLVRDFPENPDHLLFLGELYQNNQQFDLAISTFQRALSLAPKNILCPAHLADALSSAGRFQEAVTAYRQSLVLDPQNPLVMNNLAWNLALAGTNLDEALKLAQQALQRVPDSSQYADTLGFIYLKSKNFDRALQLFRGIVHKEPAIGVYRVHLAMSLIASEQKKEARVELEAALRSRNTATEAGQIHNLLVQLK